VIRDSLFVWDSWIVRMNGIHRVRIIYHSCRFSEAIFLTKSKDTSHHESINSYWFVSSTTPCKQWIANRYEGHVRIDEQRVSANLPWLASDELLTVRSVPNFTEEASSACYLRHTPYGDFVFISSFYIFFVLINIYTYTYIRINMKCTKSRIFTTTVSLR